MSAWQIEQAREALRAADAQLGAGHVAPEHERALKARLADLLLYVEHLEAVAAHKDRRMATAEEVARRETQDAIDALRPLVGLEDAYPQLVYERMRTLKLTQGRMDGLRLALKIIRGQL